MAISLAVMLLQNIKTNMTKNLDKIVNRDTPSRGGPGTRDWGPPRSAVVPS